MNYILYYLKKTRYQFVPDNHEYLFQEKTIKIAEEIEI